MRNNNNNNNNNKNGAEYTGTLLHSHAYRDARPFLGQRVLVIGSGNSAAEQALEMAESGIHVDMLVRGARYVIPRFVFERLLPLFFWPASLESAFRHELTLSYAQRYKEALSADSILRPVVLKDCSRYGFEQPTHPLQASLLFDNRIPLFDWGLMKAVRAGKVKVRRGTVAAFEGGKRVRLSDGTLQEYDSIICATGYRHGLASLVGERYLGQQAFSALGAAACKLNEKVPLTNGQGTSVVNPRLHFVGWEPSSLQSNSFGFFGWKAAQDVARDLRLANLPSSTAGGYTSPQFAVDPKSASPSASSSSSSLSWMIPATLLTVYGGLLLRRRFVVLKQQPKKNH